MSALDISSLTSNLGFSAAILGPMLIVLAMLLLWGIKQVLIARLKRLRPAKASHWSQTLLTAGSFPVCR